MGRVEAAEKAAKEAAKLQKEATAAAGEPRAVHSSVGLAPKVTEKIKV